MEFGKIESKTATLIMSNLYLQLLLEKEIKLIAVPTKRDKIDIIRKKKSSIYFQHIKRN